MLYPQTLPKLLRQVISQPSNQNKVIVLYQITIESRKFKGWKSFKKSFTKQRVFSISIELGGKNFFLKRWYLALETVKRNRNSYPLIRGKLLLLFHRTIYQDFQLLAKSLKIVQVLQSSNLISSNFPQGNKLKYIKRFHYKISTCDMAYKQIRNWPKYLTIENWVKI